MGKRKILAVLGTRPEAIKMCPVIEELRKREGILCRLCVTAQHRELLDGILDLFDLHPDYDLDLMREGQGLFDLTSRILSGIRPILEREKPDLVLVHGDTTTAFCTALAAFYRRIPVAHVEAGLRTRDLSSPFPEEWNRRAIGILAEHHFAPTERAKESLLGEGVFSERILVTGNTGIDALRRTVREDYSHPLLDWAAGSRLLLLTAHRRETQGEAMSRAFRGIRRILSEFSDVKLIYPMHPSPAVRRVAEAELSDCPRVRLVEPLGVLDFHNILARCHLVLTDSGGIQEEAPFFGKPVLILRNRTERQEGLLAGVSRLIGTGEGSVYRGIEELLKNRALYTVMSRAQSPYGDGYAARRIGDYLEKILDF